MQRTVVSALVAGALAMAAASCGGGAEPLDASAFRTQANAVCRQTQERLMRLAARAHGTVTPAVERQAVAVADDGLRKLAGVHPPAALAARFSRLNGLLAQEEAYVRRTLGAGRAGAGQTVANIHLVHRIGPAARSLGLPSCV